MPSFADAIRKDFSSLRDRFVMEQEEKAPRRLPRRVGRAPAYGTMFAIRNIRLAIQEAALRLVQIVITYRKITTGEVKKYIVAPYSYRYRRTRIGRRKMLFAYDMRDKHIKGYVMKNIRRAALTDRKFRPKWQIEIG